MATTTWNDTYYSTAVGSGGFSFYGPKSVDPAFVTTSIGSIAILANTSITISDVGKLTSSGAEDTTSIKPMYAIDGIALSEHNRKTSISGAALNTVNTRWNNKQGVYFKKELIRRTYTFNWTYLPSKSINTVDQNIGREILKHIGENQFTHILSIRNLDTNGLVSNTADTVNVLVVNYNESLVRRDLDNDEYFWDVTLMLQEV